MDSNAQAAEQQEDNGKHFPNFIKWLWNYTVVSNFMAGLFALLPVILTIAVITVVGGYIHNWIGPESAIGKMLKNFGGHFATNEWVAYCIGGAAVLVGIWFLGVLVKSKVRDVIMGTINTVMGIPVIKSVYDPVQQAVQMIKRDNPDMAGMSVVFITFGGGFMSEGQLALFQRAMQSVGIKSAQAHKVMAALTEGSDCLPGAGFLALKVSNTTFVFKGIRYSLVYMPTSPVPMSGGIVAVPVNNVEPIDLGPEAMMQVYLTLGVVADQVIPEKYQDVMVDDQEFLAQLQQMDE